MITIQPGKETIKVKCIDNSGHGSQLGLGNIYIPSKEDSTNYLINGAWWYKKRFEIVEDDKVHDRKLEDIPMPMGVKVEGRYEKLAKQIGQLVDKKNAQYGDAINSTADFLALLFPGGIQPHQYGEVGILIRIYDKMKRIANGNQGEENAWNDITGYALLMSEPDDF